MHNDFKELFGFLNAEEVRYLVVGGYAVSLHAEPRATKDLDILVDPAGDNAIALFRALAAFGAPLEGMNPGSFTEPGAFFRMGVPPAMVDILPNIAGVDFNQAWARRVSAVVDPQTNLHAHFISAADLMEGKLASGRAQDLADAEALRAAGLAEPKEQPKKP
ncbi:MAG: hypothetical protein JO056_06350 [Alphaproteobacteria bacterium]|uniref:DUF6036 family nucleotidyltransferase n=1 Tax=Bradyrhizobium sp. TaxID=376 RepID=UPI001ECE198E|nr:DUF6036 family nucleotidyltransferase [Bradyrhizobium sp.]MBV9570842.1 hypothetical protein [Alphaproteobacteria bacterium]MBV9979092.1 hypothetical protein [Bradyrhizobium sp.]